MRKLALSILVALSVASTGWALSSISAYKTFTREILTSSDLNSSFTTVISGVNNLIAIHPGDSTKTAIGAFDTLVAVPGPNLVVNDPLTSKSASDSLNYHLARIRRLNADSVYIGGTPVVGFSLAVSAGDRALFSHANVETLTVGTGETIIGDDTDIKIVSGESIDLTATTDIIIPANVGVTFGTGEKIEGDNTDLTATSGADINLTATADINVPANVGITFADDGEKIEGDGTDLTLTSGTDINLTATVVVVSSGLQVVGTLNSDGPMTVALAPVFSGGASFTNGLDVIGTTDLNGPVTVALAPVFSGGASFTAGLDVIGTTDINGPMTVALAPVFSGGASFTAGLQVDGTLNSDGPVTFALAPVFSGGATFNDLTAATADINGGTVDGTTIGAASHTTGKFTTLEATTSVNFSAASSVLVPVALTFPSGTDGYVLTSDGNGRVILEAGAGAPLVFPDSIRSAAFIRLPDTTIAAASVSVIEAYSLHNPRYMDDVGAFRMKEIAGSLRDSLGVWPVEFTIHITTAQDCVVVFDTAGPVSEYLTITFGADNATGVSYLDGVLRISTSVGVYEMDVPNDKLWLFDTGGKKATGADLASDLALGTDAVTFAVVDPSLAINATAAHDIAAVRDVFVPESGKVWWFIGTDSGPCGYNPYANAIYDNSETQDTDVMALDSRGGLVFLADNLPTDHRVRYGRTIFGVTSDVQMANEVWGPASSGSEDLAWGNTTIQTISVLESGSAAGTNALAIIVGSDDSGLYVLHAKANDNTNGGKVLINGTDHFPYEKGDSPGVYSLNALLDGSPYSNDLSKVGTIDPMASSVQMVFGRGYSSTDGATHSFLNRWADTDFNSVRSMFVWFKTDDATNSAAYECIVAFNDGEAGTDVFLNLCIPGTGSNGFLAASVGDGTSSDTATGATDVADGNWHHAAVVLRAASLDLYLDGDLHKQDASLAVVVANVVLDSFTIGADHSGTTGSSHFNGFIDQVGLSKDELSAEEIYNMHAAGRAALQAGSDILSGLHAADVDYAKCIDEGWCVTGNQDSVQVWKYVAPHLIPWKRYGTPGGNIADVAIWWSPGADSLALAIGTATAMQFIQPDPNLYAAATYRNPWVQPLAMDGGRVIIDSTGQQGVFWHGDDAVDAGFNAGHLGIHLLNGTVPSFTVDHDDMILSGESWLAHIHGTTVDALIVSGSRVTVKDLQVSTVAGGGNVENALQVTGAEVLAMNIYGSASDNVMVHWNGPRGRLIGSYFNVSDNAKDVRIYFLADNFSLVGNHVEGTIDIDAVAENGVCVGNVTDGGIADFSGSSICGATLNEEY